MIRDYEKETIKRVAWIRGILDKAGANAIVFGSSGGKDSVLAGILCRMACENTLGVTMPCGSFADEEDVQLFARHFDIKHIQIDLTETKSGLAAAIGSTLNKQADINIAPRLRMTTLYALAANRGALVAGTSNRSEIHVGYYTKWGDGGCDFNPIADLTVTEVFEFLKHLGAPEIFYTKPPSAGLFEGQTDEADMGVTYAEIDDYLLNGVKGENFDIIERRHNANNHKRMPVAKPNEI